jgi:riboflavin biosynthesis pyrimidine reductase
VRVISLADQKDGTFSFTSLMNELFLLGIFDVIIEGGGYTFSKCLEEKVVDKLLLFSAPKLLGTGTSALPCLIYRRSVMMYF